MSRVTTSIVESEALVADCIRQRVTGPVLQEAIRCLIVALIAAHPGCGSTVVKGRQAVEWVTTWTRRLKEERDGTA